MGSINISAFLVATGIGVATIASLLLVAFPGGTVWLFAITGLVWGISFLVIRLSYKALIYGEMRKIYDAISTQLQTKATFSVDRSTKLSNRPEEAIATAIDTFSALQQREIDKLRKQETFRANFLADVSHELKTPIFAIQGFIHTLLDGAMEDKKVRKIFLQKAAKNLDGLDALVKDLLTLSQIETGTAKMKFDNIDWYHLCVEVVDQFGQRSAKKSITIQSPSSEQLIIVKADWSRMVQVMSNLISNAIKYTDEMGKITIQLDVGKKTVTTSVTDTGIGIPAVHLDRIFERFYRVEKSRSKEKGGTGLGLSIVKNILEQHHTRIDVQSHPDRGSTFSFKLERVGLPCQTLHRITED